jgi:hypothetical protein
MKRLSSLLALVGLLTLFSCNKNETEANGLQGKWQLLLINDLATGTSMAKPASELREVTISFYCNGSSGGFAGNTHANIFSGEYKNPSAQLLTIESYGGTKVLDGPWSCAFSDNFIDTQSYSFDNNGKLQLHTPQKTLVFKRP